MSASRRAARASGSARGCSGIRRTRRIRQSSFFLHQKILDSPTTEAPFSNSASSCTSAVVTGRTRPVMARTSLIRLTAWSKESEMPFMAARKRFPKLWPAREPSLKR